MNKEELQKLIRFAEKKKASDIHLIAGNMPYFRINGELYPVKRPLLTLEVVEKITHLLLTHEQLDILESKGDIDIGLILEGVIMRSNFHKNLQGFGIAMRLIPERIPSIKDLMLEEQIVEAIQKSSGLIVISGPAGVGKSTTLASLVQEINRTKRQHIITLEDPIEYRFTGGKALIEQRQLHADFDSFENGLRHALRQDPNVIVVGEMRDPETIELALTAAETGHLVITTLHAPNAAEVIERIVNVFEGAKQQQVLVQLSASIGLIVSQTLLPSKKGGRVAAREILVATTAIKNAIRQNNLSNIHSAIATGKKYGMQSMEQAMAKLAEEGKI